MKRDHLIAAVRATGIMLVAALLVPFISLAQSHGNGAQQGNKGMMADSMHHAPFNTATIQTIKGKVLRVEQLPGRRQNMIGVHVVLDTGDEQIAVHLGPLSNLNKLLPGRVHS